VSAPPEQAYARTPTSASEPGTPDDAVRDRGGDSHKTIEKTRSTHELMAWRTNDNRTMSGSDNVDDAVQRVRDAFENAVKETEEVSEQARESVEAAIDDLEDRIESLRQGE
jgi:gas vesicle protein